MKYWLPNKHQFLLVALLTFSGAVVARAHGVSPSDQNRIIEGGIFDYLILGAKHMVTGYDHLLFLFGVIFFLTKFREIVKFITAFTLGHSITLIFATFLEITANEYLVDAVIALTVIYKGFDNIDGFRRFLKIPAPNLLGLVFTFGLIHGFGLSTRLQQLPLGHDDLLAKIVSFNVGVELGQVIALSVMAAALAGWRKTASFAKFSTAANIGLMLAGLALFIYQIANYTIKHDHGSAEAVQKLHEDVNHDHGDAGDHGYGDSHGHSHGDEGEADQGHSHGVEDEANHGHEHGDDHGHSHGHDQNHMHPNEDGKEHAH